jgi:predicted DNA-binding transcriptional regulator AlpA
MEARMVGTRTAGSRELLERLLLPEEAARILNLSMSWLAKARGDGTGPEFVKLGRSVRYKQSCLLKFIQEQTRTNTNKGEQ